MRHKPGEAGHGRAGHGDDEEECQDRTCSDAQSSFRMWMKKDGKVNTVQCPVNREELGRNTWSLLHTIAAKYPEKPKEQDKATMAEFIKLMSVLYPCKDCAKDFRDDISKMPPKLESRESLSQWFCDIHNLVNVKLNKPKFDCSKVDERWRTGPKDESLC